MMAETPAQSRQFDGFRPGRLWSLREMIEFKLAAFHQAVTTIQHTRTAIDSKKSTQEQPDGGLLITTISDQGFLRFLGENAQRLRQSLIDLDAVVTIKALDDMLGHLWSGALTYETLREAYDDIQKTLNRELESSAAFVLSPAERNLYSPRLPLFGEDFQNKFQTRGVFELDEAAKCRALGRPTAAVFHMMRVMEVAIQAFAKCLGLPDPTKPAERNWAIVLKAVKDGIDAKWPTAANRMHGDGQLFEGIYASLDAVKNPWRNATMHVDQKYTDTEAEDIFAAVRGFIRKLATRMDENGEPKV